MEAPAHSDLRSPGEPDDETVAARKKSRRVSFADTTAVHIFDRDEDYETPPSPAHGPNARWLRCDSTSDSEDSKGSAPEDDDNTDGNEDDDEVEQSPFVQDMESSSPGSAVGSVTSNDEDFFGPVSSSFIRPGRLSESEISDDNSHDITLDSNAFTMQYRNIQPPDDRTSNSTASIRTPATGTMLPGGYKQGISGSASGSNNAMSLLVYNQQQQYDYGKMSPTLEALLAEVNRNLHPGSLSTSHNKVASSDEVNATPSFDKQVAPLVGTSEEIPSSAETVQRSDKGMHGLTENNLLRSFDTVDSTPPLSAQAQRLHDYDTNQQDLLSLKKSSFAQSVDMVGTKRKSEQVQDKDNNVVNEINRVQKSQKILSQADFVSDTKLGHYSGCSSETSGIGNQTTPDVAVGAFEAKQQSPSISNFTLKKNFADTTLRPDEEAHMLTENDIICSSNLMDSVPTPSGEDPRILAYEVNKQNILSSKDSSSAQSINIPGAKRTTKLIQHKEKTVVNEIDRAPKSPNFLSDAGVVSETLLGQYMDSLDCNKEATDTGGRTTPKHFNNSCVATVQSSEGEMHRLADNNIPCSVEEALSAQSIDTTDAKGKEQAQHKENTLANKINRAEKSIKSLSEASVLSEPLLGHYREFNNQATDIGGQTTPKRCIDVATGDFESSEQLFSPSISNLTLQEIEIMEDILDEMQAARKYHVLYTSLMKGEHLGDPHQQRIFEARSLRYNLEFRREILQLKRVKLDLLHSKAKLSQEAVQDYHEMKSKYSLCIFGTGEAHSHEINAHFNSTSSNSTSQEEQNKVALKKQELALLDQKVNCLLKSFEVSCNLKENLDCCGVINNVNEILERLNRCRTIRQDLQLWRLVEIVKNNDQSKFVLNYCNLLIQSYIISVGKRSSIVVDNSLNYINIEKNFVKMNACMAFDFVFKAKGARKLDNKSSFLQETAVTSLLLGAVLDVLGEVQASQRELLNLIYSTFHSQCSAQLELHLTFLSFKRGQKLTIALDMTELDCGYYTSKTSKLHFRIVSGAQTTLPAALLDELTSAVDILQDGHPLILGLCRRVSEVVQALK